MQNYEGYLRAAPGSHKAEIPLEVKVTKSMPAVIHTLGLGEVIVHLESGPNNIIRYRGTPKTYKGSDNVLKAVKGQLEDIGMTCGIDSEKRLVDCHGQFKKSIDTETLALFFRLIQDADLVMMPKEGDADKIRKMAWAQADELSEDEVDWKTLPNIDWQSKLK